MPRLMLSVTVSLIWFLALLGAAAHLRDGPRTLRSGVAALATFAVTAAAAYRLSPNPNWVAVLLSVAAIWRLIAGPFPRQSALVAGACAGLAAALALAGGAMLPVAIGVTLLALAAGFLLRDASPRNAPEVEMVLVVVALASPLIGLAGDVIYGWQSAVMLSGEGVTTVRPVSPPGWTVAIVGLSLAAGLIRGIWGKR